MKRKELKKKLIPRREARGQYFEDEQAGKFFSTGCSLLDCAIGYGWPMGKIINVVGDKSTGKTLLAIEGFTNFHLAYPDGDMHYVEGESAFDIPYAERLGLPAADVEIHEDVDTVEQFFDVLQAVCDRKSKEPALVVLDSLDSLSDAEELGKKITENASMAKKARQMSQLFRRLVRLCGQTNTTVFIISQVRDKINVMFGRKHSRSGGRALDFYASIVLYLAEIGKIHKTRKGVKRTVGVNIKAKVDKNKVAEPFREVSFPIMFNYGVDDIQAAIDWLIEVKHEEVIQDLNLGSKPTPVKIERAIEEFGMLDLRETLGADVRRVWRLIEKDFRPTRSKYE